MDKVLITGAGGFIGSHLTEYLLEKGYRVRALLRYKSEYDIGNLKFLDKNVLKEVEVLRGDIKDPDLCTRAVENCTYVFHLAAQIAIPYSYANPTDFIQTNVVGTINLLNAARKQKSLKRFIQTSTSEVYGTAQYAPIDEKHPLQAQSPYSASKIGADKICESYFLSFDTPITIIRPFNTYGPRQSIRAIIPTVISQTLEKDPIHIGSLSPKRDFLFVSDTVSGFLNVGTHENTVGKTLNLGTGKTISIGELIKEIFDIMGKHPKIQTKEDRIRPESSEVFELIANSNLANELAGWEPKFTLKEGLQKTIEWIKENLHQFNTDKYII